MYYRVKEVGEKMEVPLIANGEFQRLSTVKGGLRTMPFIIANETFEKVASFGLLTNMIIYLTKEYHMGAAHGQRVLFVWSGLSNIMPLPGAFISDSYLGRFRVIAIGSILSLLGMILLWLTTIIKGANPPSCKESSSCIPPSPSQLAILYSSFALISLGAGGIRPCSLAFGADQLKQQENPNNERLLQSFFSWYFASFAASIITASTVIVYIQDQMGWRVGFGVVVILMFSSTSLYFLGSSLYIKVKANKSLLTEFSQVILAAVKNKHLDSPPKDARGWYHHSDSMLAAPTDNLRFLNKACIIRNPEDLNPSKPWNLCTVQQVEDFKSLLRVIPLWSTGIVFAVVISQSFQILQARTMNRHIGPNFQIPPGSIGVFGDMSQMVWLVIYECLIIPLLRKFSRKEASGLSVKQRMGFGLLISCAGTAVSAVVEGVRRRTAIKQGLVENGNAMVDMSVMWLVPQNCLIGIAEAFNQVGQIEFYYGEFPKSMASMGMALLSLGTGVGNLLGGLIVEYVDDISKRGGKESWVSSNLNKGHYDYYYWLLSILGFVNFLYFLGCSWAYGPCKGEGNRVLDQKEGNENGREM